MANTIPFTKLHGLGNDFIVIDRPEFQISTNLIQQMSARNYSGLGCDQFIILDRLANDIKMEIYNCDGSSAAACGNATRAVAGLYFETNPSRDSIRIITKSGFFACKKLHNGEISVNMGKPQSIDFIDLISIDLQFANLFHKLGVRIVGEGCRVSVGNPHFVYFVDDISSIDDMNFRAIGAYLQNHKLFPEAVNFELASYQGGVKFNVRVYERGAGETLACGTGASAVYFAAVESKILKHGTEAKISFKGGTLAISANVNGEIIMIGEYKKVATGEYFA